MRLFEVREMPFSKALSVFGLTADEFNKMSADDLKIKWRDLVKKSHPDLPENKDSLISIGDINAAYDSLKRSVGLKTQQPFDSSYDSSYDKDTWEKQRDDAKREAEKRRKQSSNANKYANRKTYEGIPPWQTDMRSSYNTINRNDYSDINFLKEQIWQKSGGSRTKFTIDAFDGHFFRGAVTVFGNMKPLVLRAMADGMMKWNGSETRAVFVSSTTEIGDKKMALIYSDGIYHILNPIIVEHDSFNDYAGNDQKFVRKLPQFLDDLLKKKTQARFSVLEASSVALLMSGGGEIIYESNNFASAESWLRLHTEEWIDYPKGIKSKEELKGIIKDGKRLFRFIQKDGTKRYFYIRVND